MQRSWVLAILVASCLQAQAPAPEPPAPQAPKPDAPVVKPDAPAATPEAPAPKPFDQLRPSQRKFAYHLHRAALAAHELGYFKGHPKTGEVREALGALVAQKAVLPEKVQPAVAAAEAYLAALRSQQGLYAADGHKLILGGTFKELQAASQAAAKLGTKGLESRFARLKGLLFDPKVDAAPPVWAAPEPPAKGKKAKAAKGPKAPEGFAAQKALVAHWVKQAQAWVENTTQEVEVKGEKKMRRLPDPAQTKALEGLATWLAKEDLDLLRDPAFGWMDLRRLGAAPGAGLLAHAGDIAASKAPEGAPAELALLPAYEPVLGESKFSGEEKRAVLADVKLAAAPATPAEQLALLEKLGRSRELQPK